MRFNIFLLLLAATAAIGLLSHTSQAQGILLTTATPSPAPSKTPTVTPSRPPTTQVANTPASPSIQSTFTQQDLSVLTGNVQRPNGAVWFDNKLYIACNGDWTLYELDDTTGSTVTYIYGVRNAHAMYAEGGENGDINLWIPDFETNSLLKVNPKQAPQPIARELNGPWGITYLDQDYFLVTNILANNVVLINRNGNTQELISELRSPTGITVDKDYIYIANNGSSRRAIEWIAKEDIEKTKGDETAEITPNPLISGLQNTTGLAMGEDGYLYFAYSLGTRGVIARVNPELCRENGCSHEEIEIVVYTELAAPLAGLTISPDMRLYIHTIFKPEIYWVQLETGR